MTEKIIFVDNIEILIKKNKRARHLSITVKPLAGVRITLPERVSFYEGEKLARQKIDWINEHLDKINSDVKAYPVYDENSKVLTRNHTLYFKAGTNSVISSRVKNGLIIVKYPVGKDIRSPEIQKAIRKGVENAYREEAKEFLPKRLNDLSDSFKLPFNELFIKNIKSRWGSCSGKNNINLSIHLMRLPDHLIDYVLLHELAHTKVKNHSKKFWHFLESLTGDAKVLDKELKKFRI